MILLTNRARKIDGDNKMRKLASVALLSFLTSCDILWGYTKVSKLDGNCLVGDVVCKPYEICNSETEQCEQIPPSLEKAMPSAVFSEGGERITITGNGFTPDTQVWLDDQPGTMVTVHSPQQISFVVPERSIATKWGGVNVRLKAISSNQITERMDLVSYISSVANFSASSASKIVLQGNVANLEVVDINGDSIPDIVARSAQNGEFYVSFGNGNGTFRTAISSNTSAIGGGHFILADIDSNNRPDLIFLQTASSGADGKIYYSIINANGSFQTKTVLNSSIPALSNAFLGVADLNSDNRKDLLVVDYASTKTYSIMADSQGRIGTGSAIKTSNVVNASSQLPFFSDFNKDQKTDLAIASYGSGLSIFPGLGDGGFSSGTNYQETSRYYALALADFTNDSYQDIILSTDASSQMYFLKNNSGQNFSIVPLKNKSAMAMIIMADDLNGDKNADVFAFERGGTSPVGYAFMGNGNGEFRASSQSNKTTFPAVEDFRVVDINSDGRKDLIFIDYSSPDAFILINALE